MRRRILGAILITTAIALVLFGVPLAVALARSALDDATIRLEREATLAARAVPSGYRTSMDPVELPPAKGLTLALYGPDGRLFTGTGPQRADQFVIDAQRNRIRSGEISEGLVAAVPVTADERVIGVVRAERSLRAVDARVTRAWLLLASFGAGVLILSGFIGRSLADRIARRVRTVRDEAVRLGEGDFTIAAEPTGIRELDEVTSALHTTAQRLEHALERERAFSADASHQLRTPLTSLRLIIDNELAAPGHPPEIALTEALAEIDRLEITIDSLLELAHGAGSTDRPVLDIGRVLRDASQHWHSVLAASTRQLRIVRSAAAVPKARHHAVAQALDVLVENAWRHGRGTVTVEARDIAMGVAITVTDEGPGIDADAGDIFHRHRTGRTDTSGEGIGLALARSLVDGEGGRLLLDRSQPGASFAILLPVDEAGDAHDGWATQPST